MIKHYYEAACQSSPNVQATNPPPKHSIVQTYVHHQRQKDNPDIEHHQPIIFGASLLHQSLLDDPHKIPIQDGIYHKIYHLLTSIPYLVDMNKSNRRLVSRKNSTLL